jgi:hypothetical protein
VLCSYYAFCGFGISRFWGRVRVDSFGDILCTGGEIEAQNDYGPFSEIRWTGCNGSNLIGQSMGVLPFTFSTVDQTRLHANTSVHVAVLGECYENASRGHS